LGTVRRNDRQVLEAARRLRVRPAARPRPVVELLLAPALDLREAVQRDPAERLLPARVARADLQFLAAVPDLAESSQPVLDEVDEDGLALSPDELLRPGLELRGGSDGLRVLPVTRCQLLRGQLAGWPGPG